MKRYLPLFLVYARLIMGISIPFIARHFGKSSSHFLVSLIILGFLADIFDGIIARKLKVSTQNLRLLDSVVDRIFWLMVLLTCYLLYPDCLSGKLFFLVLVLGMDALVYLISFFRFGKIPSPHNLLTKLWGICIAVCLVEIMLTGFSITFNVMIIIGMISRVDSLLIYLILKKWDHDIPSFYHAIQLSQGKEIRRNAIFNG